MVTNNLISLIERNYDYNITKVLTKLVNECDESQIKSLLSDDFYLGDCIFLEYIDGLGYNCYNKDVEINGCNHLCRLISNHLNNELKKEKIK